jgi:hypothetical protein
MSDSLPNERQRTTDALVRFTRLRDHIRLVGETWSNVALLTRPVGNSIAAMLLVVGRVWLGQTVFLHMVFAMMQEVGFHESLLPWESLLQGIAPALLTAGVFTRPIALVLLIQTAFSIAGMEIDGQQVAVLCWLVIRGAGPLSVDYLMRTGLARIPILGVRTVSRLYGWAGAAFDPLLLLGVRIHVSATVLAAAGGGTVQWWDPTHSNPIELLRSP